jgi:hypothetical protein
MAAKENAYELTAFKPFQESLSQPPQMPPAQ